jgi:peroxiredoxin family protein
MRLYVLDGRTPTLARSFDEWIAWIAEHQKDMVVASTELEDGTHIFTTFLGHSTVYSDELNPLTFSTKVFGGPSHDKERYTTSWESAEKMHEAMVLQLMDDINVEWPEELVEVQAKVTL